MNQAAEAAIHCRGLCHEVQGRVILDRIDLCTDAARVGVVGRNGSGKSTLARILAGLVRPSAGQVRIHGIDIARDRGAALQTVGLLFQNPEHQIIFPRVDEEIAFGLRQQGLSRDEAGRRASAMLDWFGNAHWSDAPVTELSQGQKHLVCMMAVLAMRPRLLILDEPFAGLDIPTRLQLARYLDRASVGLLHISHDPADLAGCDRVFWLDRGRIVADGPPAPLLARFTEEMQRLGGLDDISDLAG